MKRPMKTKNINGKVSTDGGEQRGFVNVPLGKI